MARERKRNADFTPLTREHEQRVIMTVIYALTVHYDWSAAK